MRFHQPNESHKEKSEQKMTSSAMPIMEVRDFQFKYEEDEAPVLQNIHFKLHRGESLLLLGPSGCGKSTLAYCLNKLYPEAVDGRTEGQILIEGKDLNQFPAGEICRKIGIVFQDPESQFCMTTVEVEIAFGLENLAVPRNEMDVKIKEMLQKANLLDYRNHPIHHLSGGMKQQLALACVMSLNPDILILDEPTANLDPASARELVHKIATWKKERNLSLIVIEHRLDDWMELIDRTIVLDQEGKLLWTGNPKQIFAQQEQALTQQGIWMPAVTQLALQWQKIGIFDPEHPAVTENELLHGITNVTRAQNILSERLNTGKTDVRNRSRKTSDSLKPILTVSQFNAHYGKRQVLHNINLKVYAGELLAIAGPNGSGKTTLSQHLAGIGSKHTQGNITLLDKPLSEWKQSELRQHVGYVFQNPEHQFITDTVWDEVAFSLRLRGASKKEMEEQVNRILSICRLEQLKHENPFRLSQGQKRRLSVATMLIDDQPLLLLDEPTFGQDAYTAAQLMQLMKQRVLENKTVIMITHDMELVRAYADRIVVLLDGEIHYEGQPTELWSHKELLQQARLLPPVTHTILEQLQG